MSIEGDIQTGIELLPCLLRLSFPGEFISHFDTLQACGVITAKVMRFQQEL